MKIAVITDDGQQIRRIQLRLKTFHFPLQLPDQRAAHRAKRQSSRILGNLRCGARKLRDVVPSTTGFTQVNDTPTVRTRFYRLATPAVP